jgi:hypothetical protein
MADWLQAPDDEEDGAGSIAQALADPRGTFSDENGAVPEQAPQIREGSPSETGRAADPNKASDQESSQLAQGPVAPKDDEPGVPNDAAYFMANDQGNDVQQPSGQDAQAQGASSNDQGDSGDAEAAQLAGQTFKAPAPLKYQPYADHSADEQALVNQKAVEDPTKYRPSVGRRVLAGLAGFAAGAGSRNANEGLNVAKQITGRPLDQAKEQWAAQEAPLQQRLVADKAADQAVDRTNQQETNRYNADERNMTNQARVQSWNALTEQRKALAQQKLTQVDPRTLGPVDPNNPFGEWRGKNAKGEVIRGLEPPASIQKDPRFIAQQRRKQLNDMASAGIKLTPQESKFFFINGKLAEPTEHTSINIRENPDGSPVAPKGSGGPNDPEKLIAKNMQDKEAFINQWRRVSKDEANDAMPEGSYIATNGSGKFMSGPEYNARIEKFRTDLNANTNMRKAGVMVDENGNTITSGAQNPQPAKPLQRQPQKPNATPPPSQARFNVAKWKAANPKGDVTAAIAAAKAKNYAIVGQ